jgi:hypothetical protein
VSFFVEEKMMNEAVKKTGRGISKKTLGKNPFYLEI